MPRRPLDPAHGRQLGQGSASQGGKEKAGLGPDPHRVGSPARLYSGEATPGQALEKVGQPGARGKIRASATSCFRITTHGESPSAGTRTRRGEDRPFSGRLAADAEAPFDEAGNGWLPF